MAAVVVALAATASTLAIIVALLNIREKLWPKPVKAHPLEAAVRDIAAAIRERGPDLHVRIDERGPSKPSDTHV